MHVTMETDAKTKKGKKKSGHEVECLEEKKGGEVVHSAFCSKVSYCDNTTLFLSEWIEIFSFQACVCNFVCNVSLFAPNGAY